MKNSIYLTRRKFLAITIPFISGCESPLPLTPDSYVPPNPKFDPILPPKKSIESIEALYEEITIRGRGIAKSLEQDFPDGFVINLGKKKGEIRYITMNVLKENRSKTLRVGSYIGSNPETEKKVNKYLSTRDYNSAIKTLNQSDFTILLFNDWKINGLRSSETNDLLIIRDEQGRVTRIKSPYLSKNSNKAYNSLLREIYSL
jgi:hypothetical protein